MPQTRSSFIPPFPKWATFVTARTALRAALLIVTAVVVLLTATMMITFGSVPGNWNYEYVSSFNTDAVMSGTIVGAAIAVLFWYSRKLIQRYELAVVAAWITIGFAAQIFIHTFYVYSIPDIVRSVSANQFYTISLQSKAYEFLSNYLALSTSMPQHVRANMPGKLLLYQGLGAITQNASVLGITIIAISDLGAALVYFLVEAIYHDRATSLSSMVLYLFLPAKLYFLPLLNIVSPIPVILSLLLLVQFLTTRSRVFAFLAGVALYVAAFFDPLTLALAPFFLSLVARSWLLGEASSNDAMSLIGWAMLGFVLPEIGLWMGFNFELFRALRMVSADARLFNIQTKRGYEVWLRADLFDFFWNAGAAASLACLAYAIVLISGSLRRAIRTAQFKCLASSRLRVGSLMLAAFFITVAVLDLMGINRGEVVRLWIFLAVFLQINTADFCEMTGVGTAEIVVFCSIVQTGVTIPMVGFIL